MFTSVFIKTLRAPVDQQQIKTRNVLLKSAFNVGKFKVYLF